jgi:hypothetical protein
MYIWVYMFIIYNGPTKIPRNAIFSIKLHPRSLLRTDEPIWGPMDGLIKLPVVIKKCYFLKESLILRGSQ